MKIYYPIILMISILLTSCGAKKQNSLSNDSSVKDSTTAPPNIDTTGAYISCIEPLHKKLNLKPRDQSLLNYVNSNPNRPDSVRNAIYLLPLGDMSKDVEKILKDEIAYLEIFFQLPVKILPLVPFNDLKKNDSVKTRQIPVMEVDLEGKKGGAAKDTREQIDANSLIQYYIIPNKPKDAVVILGITDHDIYTSQYNYIFGTSNLKNGAGLISTNRLKDNPSQTKMNIRKSTSKQITNLFSIQNVKDYECLLNFHNNVIELEDGALTLSSIALQKLKINIGFDYKKRCSELKDYWNKNGNENMVDYYDSCLKCMK